MKIKKFKKIHENPSKSSFVCLFRVLLKGGETLKSSGWVAESSKRQADHRVVKLERRNDGEKKTAEKRGLRKAGKYSGRQN